MVKIPPSWLPTTENVDALPEPVARYIRALELERDPTGMVRANALLRDQVNGLSARLRRLYEKMGQIVSIAMEGEGER